MIYNNYIFVRRLILDIKTKILVKIYLLSYKRSKFALDGKQDRNRMRPLFVSVTFCSLLHLMQISIAII